MMEQHEDFLDLDALIAPGPQVQIAGQIYEMLLPSRMSPEQLLALDALKVDVEDESEMDQAMVDALRAQAAFILPRAPESAIRELSFGQLEGLLRFFAIKAAEGRNDAPEIRELIPSSAVTS